MGLDRHPMAALINPNRDIEPVVIRWFFLTHSFGSCFDWARRMIASR
jgi:hypothetical protein